MKRRDFVKLSISAVGGVGLTGFGFSKHIERSTMVSTEKGRPPNFVIILADDLGAKETGCYGSIEMRTPHIDALAKNGIRFETCYATPVCSPSRVELLTGRYGFRTGYYSFRGCPGTPEMGSKEDNIGINEITFAEILQDRGYRTALAGRWGLYGKLPTAIYDCGFEEYSIWPFRILDPTGTISYCIKGERRYWNPRILQNGKFIETRETDYGPDINADFLIDFMRRNKNAPFLAYFPTSLPHRPWEPTPDANDPDEKKPASLRTSIEYLDHLVGRIVRAIDDAGIREDTIIIFAGDNGTHERGKGLPKESGVRVPLIVNCPALLQRGIVSKALIDFSDIFPTLADLGDAELPKDREIDGHSFAHLLRGERGTSRKWIFSYVHEYQILRTEHWLLDGLGQFYYCGESRDEKDYVDASKSKEPIILAAKQRLERILNRLPAPKKLEPCKSIEKRIKKYKNDLEKTTLKLDEKESGQTNGF